MIEDDGIYPLLSEIVYNLCDNAIKYNRPGGSVTVFVKGEGERIQLSVADNGIGIPPEHQKRVFERFYRVDKSHSKEVGGTPGPVHRQAWSPVPWRGGESGKRPGPGDEDHPVLPGFSSGAKRRNPLRLLRI